MLCFFVSDLHGKISRYKSLFKVIKENEPEVVLIGGDILSLHYNYLKNNIPGIEDLLLDYIIPKFKDLKSLMCDKYPKVFIILGNDDLRINENIIIEAEQSGIWEYIHNKKVQFSSNTIFGYSFVPPTPFILKDWEKYDVSRFTEVGCIPPNQGYRSVPVKQDEIEYSTIQKDIEALVNNDDLSHSIFLFHTPPYQTNLDRAGLDGQMIASVPLDVHVGSIAIKKFIEEKQPYLTLHGHIHESARITGSWKDRIGNTVLLSAAYDGPELALVRFDLDNPIDAVRLLI
jgi:uncharacterized protein